MLSFFFCLLNTVKCNFIIKKNIYKVYSVLVFTHVVSNAEFWSIYFLDTLPWLLPRICTSYLYGHFSIANTLQCIQSIKLNFTSTGVLQFQGIVGKHHIRQMWQLKQSIVPVTRLVFQPTLIIQRHKHPTHFHTKLWVLVRFQTHHMYFLKM